MAESAPAPAEGALAPEPGLGRQREVLSDLAIVGRLPEAATSKLGQGDVAGALREVRDAVRADPELSRVRDQLLDKVSRNEGVQRAMTAIGLTREDLGTVVDAAPELLEAGTRAVNGDVRGALRSLAAAPALEGPAVDVAAKAAATLGGHLPSGPAQTLLMNREAVTTLLRDPGLRQAIGQAANGDAVGAMRTIAGDRAALDVASKAIAADPGFHAHYPRVSAEDLRDGARAGLQLGAAVEALREGDRAAAAGAASDLVQTAAEHALNEPAVQAELQKIGLTADELRAAGGAAAPDLRRAASALAQGDSRGALVALRDAALQGGQSLAGPVARAVASRPELQGALSELGVTPQQLQSAARTSAPAVMDAVGRAARGQSAREVLGALAPAGPAAADLAASIAARQAQRLPEGALRNVLSDPGFVRAAIDAGAQAAPHLAAALDAAQKGDGARAGAEIAQALPALGNRALTEPVLRQVVNSPGVQEALANAGLTSDQVLQAGVQAAPAVLDAVSRLASGGSARDALAALGPAGQAAVPLITQAVAHQAQRLPEGLGRDLLSNRQLVDAAVRAGPGVLSSVVDAAAAAAQGDGARATAALSDVAGRITDPAISGPLLQTVVQRPDVRAALERARVPADQLAALGARAAGPALQSALALAAGDPQRALGALRAAAADPAIQGAARELGANVAASWARSLPEGPARSVLSRPEVTREILSPATADAVGQMVRGDVGGGLRALAGNEGLRNAALTALGEDPSVRQALSRVGLEGRDLARAGEAAPALLEAGRRAIAGDNAGAIDALRSVAPVARDMAAGAVTRLAQRLPDGIGKQLLSNAEVVREVLSEPTGKAIGELLHGDAREGVRDLLTGPAMRAVVRQLGQDRTTQFQAAGIGFSLGGGVSVPFEAHALDPTSPELTSDPVRRQHSGEGVWTQASGGFYPHVNLGGNVPVGPGLTAGFDVSASGGVGFKAITQSPEGNADAAVRRAQTMPFEIPLDAGAALALRPGEEVQIAGNGRLAVGANAGVGAQAGPVGASATVGFEGGASIGVGLTVKRREGSVVEVDVERLRGLEGRAGVNAQAGLPGFEILNAGASVSGGRQQSTLRHYQFDLSDERAARAYGELMRLNAGEADRLSAEPTGPVRESTLSSTTRSQTVEGHARLAWWTLADWTRSRKDDSQVLEGPEGLRAEAHSFNTHEASDGIFARNGRRMVDMSNITVSRPGQPSESHFHLRAELPDDPRTTSGDWQRWTAVASQVGALDEANRAQLTRPELLGAATARTIDLFLPQESMERLANLDPDRAAEAVRQAYTALGDGDPPSRGEAREQAVRFSAAIRDYLQAARTGDEDGMRAAMSRGVPLDEDVCRCIYAVA
ncbi:MAG TPA: hypothetical protein VFB81_21320, partial [Myxococcales bacterium]|nr:hypothetical protein [Myxococcales bacterium]